MPLARKAEHVGFAALGARDVPLRDPTFGDLGQIYDPWTWLGYVAGQTESIALFLAAIVLPLRHPLHTAKAAASIDQLTGGRLVLGIASGDRPVEFPRPSYPAAFASDGHVTLTLWEVKDLVNCVELDRRTNVGLHHLALRVGGKDVLDTIFARITEWPGVVLEFPPENMGEGPKRHAMVYEPGGIRLAFDF